MKDSKADKKNAYWNAHPEWSRRKHLKRKYGITIEQYDEMFRSQGGVCAVCERPQQRRRLNVDHNHITGAVRGLLCDHCNIGLGKLKDNPGLLLAALNYLASYDEIDFSEPSLEIAA